MSTRSPNLHKGQHVPLKVTYQGQDTVIDDGSSASIGSDASSTIRIVRPGISRRHAVVSQTPSGWTIEDAGSRNGSYRFGLRIDTITINATETVYLGHPTDGEKLVLARIDTNGVSSPSDPAAVGTFVLPKNPPTKTPSAAKAVPVAKAAPAAKPAAQGASSSAVPPPPPETQDAGPARSRAQRTPGEADLAELTNALRDQINAVKGLTWSVWAMIAVTAALAVMTLFVGILGS